MNKYLRLTRCDREEISRGLALGKSFRQIARELMRHPSTIMREVRNGEKVHLSYRAMHSHWRSLRQARSRRYGKYKLIMNATLRPIVEDLLRKRWSPRQIVNRLKKEYPHDTDMRLSHEAIYSYVYVLPKGALRKELIGALRRQRQRRRRMRSWNTPTPMEDMVFINERPQEAEDRRMPGHWEGDILMGRDCQSFLGTLVERKTRFLILTQLKNKSAREVRQAFAQKMEQLPAQLKRTLTYDQGREMAEHKLFTKETQVKVYFCHPKSPWERGTCENTNGLIRQFFPKGTDFGQISPEEIERVEYLLNDRPRGVLGWDKPCEAMAEVLR